MDAANTLDWSMGSYASRLADWGTAVDIGRRVSGPGVPVPSVERARLREDMAEIVPRAEGLIRGFTDMEVQGFRSRAWVMARSEWIRANLNGLQRLLEPLAERMLDGRPTRAEFKRKALGAQTGALMGYVARKVLGQYDVFLPPDDEGLLYFVGPNIVEAERRFSLPPKDFRLWIAIHEVTHRVQFGSATWLRGYLSGQVDDYLGSIQLDSSQLMNQLRRAAEEARSGVAARHRLPSWTTVAARGSCPAIRGVDSSPGRSVSPRRRGAGHGRGKEGGPAVQPAAALTGDLTSSLGEKELAMKRSFLATSWWPPAGRLAAAGSHGAGWRQDVLLGLPRRSG